VGIEALRVRTSAFARLSVEGLRGACTWMFCTRECVRASSDWTYANTFERVCGVTCGSCEFCTGLNN
jgi:hypothetical protein